MWWLSEISGWAECNHTSLEKQKLFSQLGQRCEEGRNLKHEKDLTSIAGSKDEGRGPQAKACEWPAEASNGAQSVTVSIYGKFCQ